MVFNVFLKNAHTYQTNQSFLYRNIGFLMTVSQTKTKKPKKPIFPTPTQAGGGGGCRAQATPPGPPDLPATLQSSFRASSELLSELLQSCHRSSRASSNTPELPQSFSQMSSRAPPELPELLCRGPPQLLQSLLVQSGSTAFDCADDFFEKIIGGGQHHVRQTSARSLYIRAI